MPVERIEITEEELIHFGKAEVYLGSVAAQNLLVPVGIIEGDVVVEISRAVQTLTYQEYTADAPLRQKVQTSGLRVTLPIAHVNEDAIALLSPTGDIDLGSDNFRDVNARTLLIISQDEIPDGGLLSYNGTTWAPAAPVRALWIWKAVPMLDRLIWGWSDLGKRVLEVPIVALFDPTKPAKQKMGTFGDPVAKGISTIRV